LHTINSILKNSGYAHAAIFTNGNNPIHVIQHHIEKLHIQPNDTILITKTELLKTKSENAKFKTVFCESKEEKSQQSAIALLKKIDSTLSYHSLYVSHQKDRSCTRLFYF
jgi:hypothetical protein